MHDVGDLDFLDFLKKVNDNSSSFAGPLVMRISVRIIFSLPIPKKQNQTRKHSRSTPTDRAVTRPSSERVAIRPIVERQTPVKTLRSPCGWQSVLS